MHLYPSIEAKKNWYGRRWAVISPPRHKSYIVILPLSHFWCVIQGHCRPDVYISLTSSTHKCKNCPVYSKKHNCSKVECVLYKEHAVRCGEGRSERTTLTYRYDGAQNIPFDYVWDKMGKCICEITQYWNANWERPFSVFLRLAPRRILYVVNAKEK